MKKALLLIVLLIVVLAVSTAIPRKPGCKRIQNCKSCHSRPFSCDKCDRGFFREKVPLGYACRKTCSPGLYSVKGTCVEKQDCPLNCKTCQNRLSCSVCEDGHVLYKGLMGLGKGRCIKKCPSGLKQKVDRMGGNKCVKSCTANCKLCESRSCSVCEHGHALYKGLHQRRRSVCIKECPKGHRVKVNPKGGNECVRLCTANCKLCRGRSCSVCEHGYALYKVFRGKGNGVCMKKCPRGHKAKGNPTGGNECVKSCEVAHCESCPRGWNYQRAPNKCARCESGFYRLSVWRRDFCFSHCPAGYGPRNVNGVAQCEKEPEIKYKVTTEPFTMPEFTTTTEAESTPSEEPTTEPGSSTTSEPSTTPEPTTEPEPVTEPEPTTLFTDFWP